MHILIAPNAFKNSLDAAKVAEAIQKGLDQSKLSCTTTCFPVGDGGDGTAALLVEHLKGKWIQAVVHDPLGRKISSCFGLVDKDNTAIIELADASGLRLLIRDEYAPLHTTTFGTGELIIHALDNKVNRIVLCIGGSATVDCGTGILRALGIRFFDKAGKELDDLPAALLSLSEIDTTQLDKRIENVKLVILCDVENPLLGTNGASAVFGPQKGASDADVRLLEACLTQFRDITLDKTGKDMAEFNRGGAAGGVAAGLHVFFDASLLNGIDYFLEVTDFNKALENADLVITGEGSMDKQTLEGKGPLGVAKKAREQSIPVIGISGKLTRDKELEKYFDRLLSINEDGLDLELAIKNTQVNLQTTALRLGDELSKSPVL